MALSFPSQPQNGTSSASVRMRGAANAQSSWGGLSSMLRLAAADRRAGSSRPIWWSGMSRLLRAAGTNPQARPLHAVLAGGDFSSNDARR